MLLVTQKTSGRMGRAYAVAETRPTARSARTSRTPAWRSAHPVVTLDAVCAERGIERVDFIRMDIEGAEQKALEGGIGIIDRDRPHVLLEIHPVMLQARFGSSGDAVLDLFRDRGYRMFALADGRLEERTTLVEGLPWKDYFFIHPTRAAKLPDGVFKARMAA